MKNSRFIVVFLSLAMFVSGFISCDKKKHEIVLDIEGDTVKTTFIQLDTLRDTIFIDQGLGTFININEIEIKDIAVSVTENTVNGTEVLTFQNQNSSYALISGEGFIISGNHVVVSDQEYLDFEVRKEIDLVIEITSGDTIKAFNVLVFLSDEVDVEELKAHFDFDNQDLKDNVTGGFLSLTGVVSYDLSLSQYDNYLISLVDNEEDKVLEWDDSILDLNQDFSICLFAQHKFQTSDKNETLIAGYDEDENEVIRLFFEDSKLNVALNGNTVSNLFYLFYNPTNKTEVRAGFIKGGGSLSLRVNGNGISETVYSEQINDVTHWSIGASKSSSSPITDRYNNTLDNIRFYQKALTEAEYNSIVTVDF